MAQVKQKKKGKKLPKRTGKGKTTGKYLRYYARVPRIKLVRILRDHGRSAAESWADRYDAIHTSVTARLVLTRLLRATD